MRTLRGRIGLVLLLFGLTTLISMGGALWVSLRDLHRDAALGSLAELTVPYAGQARTRIPLALLRPVQDADGLGQDVIERFRDSPLGRRAAEQYVAFVRDAQQEIAANGISVLLISDGSTVLLDPQTGEASVLSSAPPVAVPVVPGAVQTGTTEVADLGEVLYALRPIREPRTDRAVPALMLVRADDSARLATADLTRALTVAGLLLIGIGIPLAVGLSRSVTRPLRRLAAASATVAAGRVPEALPTAGPIEVAEASAAFNAMAAEVGATREAQRQLLADIRHDLRTPLTVIGGFSQALQDGTATGESADRAAAAIADEAARLERMLDDLDHLTVAGLSGPSLRLETIDSLELAAAAVERFAAEAESRGQSLTLGEAVAGATMTADRDVVDRILGNVIANALAHAPSPGGNVRLEVAVVEADAAPVGGPGGWSGRRGVLLAVRDDGPGIPTAALPHVFDRFYRADPSRTSRGSGLGLAIVRDLADALGGRAFAENLSAGGARVGVVLPAATGIAAARVAT